jgi:hypothetical protein
MSKKIKLSDLVICDFKHNTNKGGLNDYRDEKMRENSMKYLISKWNGAIIPHKKRKNEVTLKTNWYNFI